MKRSGIVCAMLVVASLCAPMAMAAAEKGDWVLRFGVQSVDPSGEFDTRETYTQENALFPNPGPFGPPLVRGNLTTNQETRFSGKSDVGYFASMEYRWTELVGLELALSEESADLAGFTRVTQSGIPTQGGVTGLFEDSDTVNFDGSIDVRALSLGLNIHHDFGFMELTLGALAAQVLFDGLTLDGVEYDIEDDFGWGWQVGLDFPLGESKWFVAFSVRYIKVTADVKIDDIPGYDEDLLGNDFAQVGFEDTSYNHDPYVVRIGAGYRF